LTSGTHPRTRRTAGSAQRLARARTVRTFATPSTERPATSRSAVWNGSPPSAWQRKTHRAQLGAVRPAHRRTQELTNVSLAHAIGPAHKALGGASSIGHT